MPTRLLCCLAGTLASTAVAAAQPRTVIDPNDLEKTRAMISRAEREELGLAEKTWDGVVQTDVYAKLAELEETVERLRNTRTKEALQMLARVRFQGTVYVQVLLKQPASDVDQAGDNARIADVQRRVLGELSATEFHVYQLFDKSAGMLGYASKDGLDKLGKHPDVQGVCLDDNAMPDGPPLVFRHQFPDPQAGEFDGEPGLKAGRVEVNVYQALRQNERVFVLVSLEPKDPLPKLTDNPSEMYRRWLERDGAIRALQDRVLSVLTADDFWLATRLGGGPGLGGYLNRQGLERLWQDPNVFKIGLESVMHVGD